MRGAIYVSHDGDATSPEVQISGSGSALVMLATAFEGTKRNVSLQLSHRPNKYYPISLEELIVACDDSRPDGLVQVDLAGSGISFTGEKSALRKISDSLRNVFSARSGVGEHFQLDYYPGNQTLAETSITLIFACDE